MTTLFAGLRPFLAALVVFYAAWSYLVIGGDRLDTVVDNWSIAVAMLFGSYVAGSTPMGGGTVGFPILVLLQDHPAALGRDFSFAVQAVGMTSASLYILARRQPLEWPMLRAAMLGAAVGTPLGVMFLAPLIGGLSIKLLFAVLWASFGVYHLRRMDAITGYSGITPTAVRFDTWAGLLVGFLGSATVGSATGVGVDMALYMALVLLCHADLRIAIPTSVVLMAFVSVIGVGTKLLTGTVEPGVFEHWLAAAPVVAVGAPFGALVVSRVGRRPTLVLVSLLCVGQFAWTLWHERQALDGPIVAATAAAVGLFLVLFLAMDRIGRRLARRAGHSHSPRPGQLLD